MCCYCDLSVIVVSILKVTQFILYIMKLYSVSLDICKQCLSDYVFEYDAFIVIFINSISFIVATRLEFDSFLICFNCIPGLI